MLLFPRAKIRILPFIRWPYFRAWFFAAIWILIQVLDAATLGERGSGIAYWTYFVGFAIGMVAAACWKEFAIDTERLISEVSKDH